ncbi:glycosyltransferase family 4 protein [Vibrio sp. E150_011]
MRSVAIITNICTPYRELLFSKISKQYDELTVYYTQGMTDDRDWTVKGDFSYVELRERFSFKGSVLNKGIIDIFRRHDSFIIGGYKDFTCLILIFLCIIFNKKYSIFFDGISPSRVKGGGNVITRFLKLLIFTNAYKILANGLVSREYIESINKDLDGKIINQYLSTRSFVEISLGRRNRARADFLCNKLLKEDSIILVYSGRLIERKNVELLISVIDDLPKNYYLFIAGEGEMRQKLRSIASKNVFFLGHLQTKELEDLYCASDALILPSRDEPWGLVVNEAIAFGTPVIVSDDCGSASTLVNHGINGFIYSVSEPEKIKKHIEMLGELDTLKSHQECNRLSKLYSIENSAISFLDVIFQHKINSKG